MLRKKESCEHAGYGLSSEIKNAGLNPTGQAHGRRQPAKAAFSEGD